MSLQCWCGLAGAEVFAQRRHQVTDILPAPEPEVTEHVAQSKRCPCCGTVTEGVLPPGVRARASFGPEAHAQAAERTIRPVKVQQRASGGCWRTLDGLADFAVVRSYLSTASKWGVPKIDALRGLFGGNPWMPPGVEPLLTG